MVPSIIKKSSQCITLVDLSSYFLLLLSTITILNTNGLTHWSCPATCSAIFSTKQFLTHQRTSQPITHIAISWLSYHIFIIQNTKTTVLVSEIYNYFHLPFRIWINTNERLVIIDHFVCSQKICSVTTSSKNDICPINYFSIQMKSFHNTSFNVGFSVTLKETLFRKM